MDKYNPQTIEKKWQKVWEAKSPNKAKDLDKKPKYYCLIEFPYPSGEGLHVGHTRSNTAMDIIARKRRMQGFNVLYPIGWDAFGLPTENYAIKKKMHPKDVTKKNTDNFRKQLKSLGFSFDWDREINTTDPKYYKWTQWIFLQLYKNGLAYKKKQPINWCPSCKTGLANEEVIDGKCERCGAQTEKREKEQWMLAITKYAERLDKDLDDVDYLEKIKIQQRNWIGKSQGAEIDFKISESDAKISVFTTRVDTIFGCTYVVVAPEHPLIENLAEKIENLVEVKKYISDAAKKSDLHRTELQKEKTGVELQGIKAINPFNDEKIPVYVADYVLGHYGTGAVMAVPAHDERDWEFAKKYNLPIQQSVASYWKDNPREDKETERREVATAIVKNPKDNTYLCLNWKTTEWKSFPTGGIDGGDPIEAAMREVKEETGYKNLKFIRQIGDSVFAEFYRPHKGSNVFSNFKYFLFELENEDKEEVNKKENDQHEALWIKEENIEKFINVWNQKLTWKRYRQGDFAYCEDGVLINSGEYNGLFSEEARQKMMKWLEKSKQGKAITQFKLRDWVFSRQHYWGEPIPIVNCLKCGSVPLAEKDLPLELPDVKKYEPADTGESPLATITDWVNTKCPKCGGPAKRETDTMPNWAGSSWYFLRYMDPNNSKALADKDKLKYWAPVDWYNGGMEHTTLHLLYSRFWNKFLFDIGVAPTSEPYQKRTSHGMILGPDGEKMSKSRGNVINPDEIVSVFGADAYRLYQMFMGPFDQSIPWDPKGIEGTSRFLQRVWKLQEKVEDVKIEENKKLTTLLHKTIKKIGEDIEEMRFNTVVSSLMILSNEMDREDKISTDDYSMFLMLLSPIAPHIAEELWSELGHQESIFLQKWPEYDPQSIVDEEITMAVQFNGKTRGTIAVSPEVSESEAKDKILSDEKLQKYLSGKEIKKMIFVKGRLINFVVSS